MHLPSPHPAYGFIRTVSVWPAWYNATMHPDGCEAILWREGPRRCELWVMNGRGELRVFDGDQLMRLEALTPIGYVRAQELRQQAIEEQRQRVDD